MIKRSIHHIWLSIPFRLFVVFLIIYGLTSGDSLSRHSMAPHFVYLAESFLHGRLHLIHVPDPPYDLTPFEGHWYVSFPPLPALLMLPLVAILGLAVSDVSFNVVIGALNVSLIHVALSRLASSRADASQRIHKPPSGQLNTWFCVLLGLGTPLWYCAAMGTVWYTAHIVAVTCLCLYAIEVLGQNRPILSGLWLGLGFLARPPVLLAFPFTATLGLYNARNHTERLRFLLMLALGMLPALLGQATYNWARFGTPLEFGYRWMNGANMLMERQAKWGQFSLHFLPENLYTMLVRPPSITPAFPHIQPDPWGMGMLFTCPLLCSVLIRTTRRPLSQMQDRPMRIGLWLSIALVQLPALLYFNTGSLQFGYRFALDWLPLGILLAALGIRDRLYWQDKALIVAGVLIHLWGVLWLYPNFNDLPWHLQYTELLSRLLH